MDEIETGLPIQRICIWSGPRNISTALMYSFSQRNDTRVVDEPFYAHYLTRREARCYHPGAETIIASMSSDSEHIIQEQILGPSDRPVLFFKMMTHHLVDMDWSFLARTTNVILTRDPLDMLPSYAKNVAHPTMDDVGYAQHHELLCYLEGLGQAPVVLDGRLTLLDPESVLRQLCEKLGLDFDANMLHWPAGPRPEDGVWAPHWYDSIHQTTGFQPYKAKSRDFPPHLRPLLGHCIPLYNALLKQAITP